eukprot:TRINITY_DN9925_c0_g3_i1.p1 TRINITY_DN9925_c0_g3~~TRINITY_DN9925_c0_g3_i1.p1  ORF type:complete len:182 (-),score=68.24 TRINITY_DN9925_c0_g3_i1:155-700(-)
MNEGDVVVVFSQFGEVVDCHMGRNRDTGEPEGFCHLAYEDQRSTDLAVDNFNGTELCGSKIKVDHAYFRIPKEYTDPKKQKEGSEDKEAETKLYIPSGPDGKGWGEFRKLNANDLKMLANEDSDSHEFENSDQGIDKTPVYDRPEEVKSPRRSESAAEGNEKLVDDDERVALSVTVVGERV